MLVAATANAMVMIRTTVECPREKKKPTPNGCLPFWIRKRAVVVYGGNVISVEGMAESEAVCECP